MVLTRRKVRELQHTLFLRNNVQSSRNVDRSQFSSVDRLLWRVVMMNQWRSVGMSLNRDVLRNLNKDVDLFLSRNVKWYCNDILVFDSN